MVEHWVLLMVEPMAVKMVEWLAVCLEAKWVELWVDEMDELLVEKKASSLVG